MKKSIFIFLFLWTASLLKANAQDCVINLVTGQTLQGTVIEVTDTTVNFIMTGSVSAFTIPAARIKNGTFPNKNRLSVQDGKIIIQTPEEIKAIKAANVAAKRQKMAGNPNNTIGKALKLSGTTSLIVGVPCFAAGLATCIAGNVMSSGYKGSGLLTKSELVAASYYLLPIGASLTIVGVPLYIEGKKIMELDVKYSGNGVGLAMNF